MILNNLCPECEAKRVAGEDISAFTERLKIDISGVGKTDVILVCIHEGDCSILDIGTCTVCQKRGFLVPPEEQVGILTSRDEVDQLEISLQAGDRGFYCKKHGATKECQHCGSKVRSLITLNTVLGEVEICYVCQVHYRECHICHSVHTLYNEELDSFICSTCASGVARCSCGSLVAHENILNWFGEKACHDCTTITNCEWCNEHTNTRNQNGAMLCKTHYKMFKEIPTIEGYHHTKAKTFHKEANEGKTKCFLGIEWEAQLNISSKKFPLRTLALRRRLMAGKVKNLFPDAECKRDGSLSVSWNRSRHENGVEVVWQPMTFEYIQKHKDAFKEMFKVCRPMLHRLMQESGMHIHISKSAFAAFHFLKFTNFFYTQSKQGFLFHMAQRSVNPYSKIKSSYSCDGEKYSIKATGARMALYFQQQKGKSLKIERVRGFNPERYDVLNITNEHTFEIRAFKSPKTYEDFMANIEYVYAMYVYTKDVSQSDMSLGDFFKFVRNNSAKFPELLKKVLSYKGDI